MKFFQFRHVHLTFDGLVIVPENVRLDGIEPSQLQFQHSIAPERFGRAGIMKTCTINKYISTFDREALRVVTNDLRFLELRFVRGLQQCESPRHGWNREQLHRAGADRG